MANIDRGIKTLKFPRIDTTLITLTFFKGGSQTPLRASMGGMAGLVLLDPPLGVCVRVCVRKMQGLLVSTFI